MTVKPNWAIMPFIDCWEYTREAISDVLLQDVIPHVELLLVDNGSKREAAEAVGLFSRERNVWLWRHNPPLPSVAATWNRALDMVWEAGGAWAWVVNNDVRIDQQTYQRLLTVLRSFAEKPLFVSAVGVDEETWKNRRGVDLTMKGGPDFSCYVITRECHEKYRFDENFVPAYHEDNDYHRRVILGGDGDRIFSVNVPYLHYGSRTIHRDEKTEREWAPKFEKCREYYIRKWGGLPGHETYDVPFGMRVDSGLP